MSKKYEDNDENKKSDKTNISESSDNKLITFIKLKDNEKTEIRHIYHISDIHIRNTQRHIEYKEVFERTYQKLKSLIGTNKKTSLIVLTGDIMHTKTELSPEAIYIAYHFFRELNEITTVILIPGNHDCNLSNKNRLDALSPIVEDIGKLNNLYYLKKSGIYQYYNIVFGITSIFDDILVSAKKINPEIWKNIKQKNKYKIALYHGAVHGAKTDVGYRMNNEQLLAEDFDGYDYVMLGDIHKYQYMNDKQTIAYAGSLIQQSYGESLHGHGILKWDLFDGESELLEIKNDYGYCTVKLVDGKIVETKIPRKPKIRFILENTNQIQYQEILNSMEKEYQICEIVKESNFKTKIHNISPTQKKLKKEVTAYSTQENIIKTYLAKKNLAKEKIRSIVELHKKIYQKILADKKEQVADSMHNATKNQKWKILELRFSNMLSYGKDNIIDFKNYEPNKIIGIVAPNHFGKSAILDIILFCLFDKFNRGERRDILNKNENHMYCSILLRVGSQQYLIERIGQRNKNGLTVKIDVNFYSIGSDENGKKIKEKLNGLDKNDTNKKIIELIGDYNDYLTTCFCLQQGKSSNFIDMTQKDKKEYLNEILKLNVFEDCYNMAKDKLKKLTGQLQLLEQKVGLKPLDEIKKNIKIITTEIARLNIQKQHIDNSLMEELDYILETLADNHLIKYNELSEYNLETADNILKNITDIKNKLNVNNDFDFETTNRELEELRKQLKDLEEKEQCVHEQLIEEKCDIRSLVDQKERLIKRLINIPKKIDKNIILILEEEKEELINRIKIIEITLKNNKNDDLSEKINRIDELKSLIAELRKSLKPVDQKANEKLQILKNKLVVNEELIKLSTHRILTNDRILDESEKEKLLFAIKIKKNFAKHIKFISQKMEEYQFGFSDNNDDIIQNIKKYSKNWLDEYREWSSITNKRIEESNVKQIDISVVLKESSKLLKEIMYKSIDFFSIHDNIIINKKISKAEAELDTLSEFSGTKKEIDNLEQEKKLLTEKIKILENKIEEIKKNLEHLESNEKIQIEINNVQKKIDEQTKMNEKMTSEIRNLKNRILKLDNIINQYKSQIEENKKLKEHLKLMEEYYLIYLNWCQKNDRFKKWSKIKKEFDEDINMLTKEIEKKQIELAIHKKDAEQYFEYRELFDKKNAKTNIYQLYVKVMDYNGLPYEMLKTYLPLIEADVNQILHSLVNFNIEFMFFDEGNLEEQKIRQLKSNNGCVDINICYHGMKSYNVRLTSGFEKFIIGLAIRMTLSQISLTAKPNFLIIDEGWSCLDTENLNNVGTIMNYIKMQYEHIIIISHLEELKNQADYVINIEKNNGYSYIKIENKMIVHRKKIKKSKEIVVV